MRENASFLSKLFYRYPWPLLESSMTQKLRFEQYGELPDRLLIKHEEKLIEENIQHYIKQDPQDRFAFMKGLFAANKFNFVKFSVVRFFLQIDEFLVPYVMSRTLDWIQKSEEEPLSDTLYMLALALSVPFVSLMVHTIWEYFCFQMIEVGHRAHTALKVMLFRKNFKMTNATNKDFSSGEVQHIIMGESGRVWDFIWSMPDYFECPIQLIASSIIVFQQIGWYGLISVLFVGIQIFKDHARGKMEKEINEKRHEKSSKRHQLINESFSNIKTVKLYGWE